MSSIVIYYLFTMFFLFSFVLINKTISKKKYIRYLIYLFCTLYFLFFTFNLIFLTLTTYASFTLDYLLGDLIFGLFFFPDLYMKPISILLNFSYVFFIYHMYKNKNSYSSSILIISLLFYLMYVYFFIKSIYDFFSYAFWYHYIIYSKKWHSNLRNVIFVRSNL